MIVHNHSTTPPITALAARALHHARAAASFAASTTATATTAAVATLAALPTAALASPGLGGVAGADALNANQSDSPSDPAAAPAWEQGVADAADKLLDTIQALPMTTHSVVVALFVGGLVLAIFGKNSLRLGFALLGLLVGIQLALFLPAAFGFSPAPLVAASVGAGAGLLVGLLAYKFTVMITLGLAGALLAPMAVAAGLYINDPALSSPPDAPPPAAAADTATPPDSSALDRTESLLTGAARDAAEAEARREARDRLGEDFSNRLEQGAATLARFVGQLGHRAQPYWERMSTQQQITVVGSSLLGLVLGLAFGAFLPDRAAALVTAFAGTAVFLPSGLWLYGAFNLPAADKLPTSPFLWLVVWLALSILFLFVRIDRGAKRGGRRTPQHDPERPRPSRRSRRAHRAADHHDDDA